MNDYFRVLFYKILNTLLECSQITLCNDLSGGLKEFDNSIEEFEFLELMEDQSQWRSANGTNSTSPFSVSDFLTDPAVATLGLVGAPAILAAVSPPPISMFPPQGAPQPGSVAGGGGVPPAISLIVINNIYKKFLIVNPGKATYL